MTILNIASDGFFNVLIVLHRTLVHYGPMNRDRLIALCVPGQDGDVRRLRETLLRWTQLGLFQESKDGKVTLEKHHKNTARLPRICRRLLLSKENNERFWDNDKTRSADFTRALTFILCQDIYKHDFGVANDIQELERHQVREENRRILQNDVRWNGLRFWGDYLGFFWVDERRWPDPTGAVRDELANVFGDQRELAAADFLARLAEQLPVLDGGHYRAEVEVILDPSEWHRSVRPDQLSTSLSRAVWRLSRPGAPLRLETRADAGDVRTLQRAGSRDWETFSHVMFSGGG